MSYTQSRVSKEVDQNLHKARHNEFCAKLCTKHAREWKMYTTDKDLDGNVIEYWRMKSAKACLNKTQTDRC
eukprot:5654438-Amphidinium_carterae.1